MKFIIFIEDMRILITCLLVTISTFCVGQSEYNYSKTSNSNNALTSGCQDLDETILNILSIFINDPEFGFFGCSDIIPYLESQFLIPLNCSTDLTPFGYFDMNVSDICECSCQEFLNLHNPSLMSSKLIHTIDITGRNYSSQGFQIEIYDDGSINKKYFIKK